MTRRTWHRFSRIRLAAAAGLFALLASGRATAVDRYAARFNVGGPQLDEQTGTIWVDRISFHNTTALDLTVRPIGVSNGQLDPAAHDLIVPSGRTVSVRSDVDDSGWAPRPAAPLWVVHLDVPEGIVIESRLELAAFHIGSQPSIDRRTVTAFPLPVHSTPSASATFLGTDLGSDENGLATNARINVVIYNSSAVPSVVVVESRRACDESVIERRTVSLMGNTAAQLAGLSTDTTGCTSADNTSGSYVVVSMGQPGLAWETTLANGVLPLTPVGVSFTF
jgi:hypothetical protein